MADQHQAMLDAIGMLGVHVVTDSDPAAAAARMADENDIEIVSDRAHALEAFAARADAGRTGVVVIGDRERAELDQAAAAGPSSSGQADPAVITTLRQLGEELRRIDRIHQRTEDRFTEGLSERLAEGS